MQITDVRIRKVEKEGKMKAVVSITIDEEFGCVYYLPQKRLAKIDRNTAKNLKDCQDGKAE